MHLRWLISLLAAAAVVAACGGDDTTSGEDDRPVTTPTITTDGDGSASTESGEGTAPEEGLEEGSSGCVSEFGTEAELIVVESDQADTLEEALTSQEVPCRRFLDDELLGPDSELSVLLNNRYERPLLNQDGTERAFDGELLDILGATFFAVDRELVDRADPSVFENGVEVFPLAKMELAGHWSVMPAVAPEGATSGSDPTTWQHGTGTRYLVVDSGFTDWSAPFIQYAAPDLETPGEGCVSPISHGTFVASLIKQAQPESFIAGIGVPPLRDSCEEAEGEGVVHKFTDDFAVAVSLYFGVKEAGPTIVNLSVGGPGIERKNGDVIPPFFLGKVVEHYAGLGIDFFAAGGNSTADTSVYPAGLDGVLGVGAGKEDGGPLIRWNGNHDLVTEPNLPEWIAEVARGCNLVGHGGIDAAEAHVWSGSSFAAPMRASGGANVVVDDVGQCG